jgi:L-amino acid N-acyltransferase YncA
VSITPTADASGGLFSAIVQAVRPAAPAGVLIRPMQAADASAVLTIYQAGLDTGQASFETTAPAWEVFDAARLPLHHHVAADVATGQAVGIWTIQSGVFPGNAASLRLHERAGFRVVGTRERIGCHYGRWRDVVFIERRSAPPGSAGFQFFEQRADPGGDVVADRADLLDAQPGRVGQLPHQVALAGEHRAGIPAAHRDHDVRGFGLPGRQRLRYLPRDVHPDFGHRRRHGRVHLAGRL